METISLYNDAESTTLALIREASAEFYSGKPGTGGFVGVLDEYLHRDHNPEANEFETAAALIAAMARHLHIRWFTQQETRIGHIPTEEEMSAAIDEYEMTMLETQDDDE